MKLSKRANIVQPSATLSITSKANQMKAQGLDVVSLGAGEPDFDTPEAIKQAAVSAIQKGYTKYTPTAGIPDLRKAICQKLADDNGLAYEPEDIVVSCGAKHALYNVVQACCDEGDEIIIPSPFWVSYPEMANLALAKPVFLPTTEKTGFKITPPQLEAAITPRSRLLVINSPSNPTGSVYTRAELEALAAVALKAPDLMILSDDIYEHIVYPGASFTCAACLGAQVKDRTVVVNGLSKSHSMTGWRIGYSACRRELAQAIGRIQDHSTSNATSIAQYAALEALRGDQGARTKMVAEFGRRRDWLLARVAKIGKLSAHKPDGAFYLFIDIRATGLGSMEFSKRLLEEKRVAVIPGLPFGSDAHIRISFATSMQNLEKAFDRIEEFVR